MRPSRSLLTIVATSLALATVSVTGTSQEDSAPGKQGREEAGKQKSTIPVRQLGELVGYEVRDRRGEELGEITEFVIEPRTGRVAYALLSLGGVLGIGDRLVAVNWSELHLDFEEKTCTLDVTEKELEEATPVNPEKLPATAPPLPRIKKEKKNPSDTRDDDAKENQERLELRVKKGQRLSFTIAARHPSGEEANGSAIPRDRKVLDRTCRLVVQDVTDRGDITLMVAIEPGAPAPDGESEQETDPRVTTLKLGPDGRLRNPRDAASVPPELEAHFRMIFGSGLHRQELEKGELYSLQALYSGEKSGSLEMKLRHEGTSGDHVRFTVLVPERPEPRPVSLRGETIPGNLEGDSRGAIRRASETVKWKNVGEVTYQKRDGFLDKVTLSGKLPPFRLNPGDRLSIFRADSIR